MRFCRTTKHRISSTPDLSVKQVNYIMLASEGQTDQIRGNYMHIKIIPELRSDWIIVINKENGRSMLLCRNNDVVGRAMAEAAAAGARLEVAV